PARRRALHRGRHGPVLPPRGPPPPARRPPHPRPRQLTLLAELAAGEGSGSGQGVVRGSRTTTGSRRWAKRRMLARTAAPVRTMRTALARAPAAAQGRLVAT